MSSPFSKLKKTLKLSTDFAFKKTNRFKISFNSIIPSPVLISHHFVLYSPEVFRAHKSNVLTVAGWDFLKHSVKVLIQCTM